MIFDFYRQGDVIRQALGALVAASVARWELWEICRERAREYWCWLDAGAFLSWLQEAKHWKNRHHNRCRRGARRRCQLAGTVLSITVPLLLPFALPQVAQPVLQRPPPQLAQGSWPPEARPWVGWQQVGTSICPPQYRPRSVGDVANMPGPSQAIWPASSGSTNSGVTTISEFRFFRVVRGLTERYAYDRDVGDVGRETALRCCRYFLNQRPASANV